MGVLLAGILLLAGCGGGESGRLSPAGDTPTLDQQAITNLIELYRTAVQQEDIDRLQELLQSQGAAVPAAARSPSQALRQEDAAGLMGAESFRSHMSTTFRTLTVTDVQLPAAAIAISPDGQRVTLQEVESVQDPATLEQRTRLWQTTWQLARDAGPGVVTFRIATVERAGPLVEVVTPGQILAGIPARIEVHSPTMAVPIASVQIEVPETGEVQPLTAADWRFHGSFTPPTRPAPQPLRIRLAQPTGEVLELAHTYRLRMVGDGVVQQLPGTAATRFFAVVLAPDGTLWAGSDGGAQLYRVAPGVNTAVRIDQLLTDSTGRVTDLVVDQRGRLHALVSAPEASGDIVIEHGIACQTVNVFSADYPFRVLDPQSSALLPSPSTRAIAAENGAIWLLGSDGGVTRVADTFQAAECPEGGVAVRYEPIFRREDSGLLTNSVPAMVVGNDAALWFGTALGLTRLRQGEFTPVLFGGNQLVIDNVATLESFFQAVAQAIFEARPLSTVAIGNVSFLEAFGRSLVKEDLIFSAIDDRQGHLWAGTLGGGLRRIDMAAEPPRDTLHLTRQDGLGSNNIFALATGLAQTLWAATEEGVSRLDTASGTVTMTHFSALDGLALPVRDVTVDAQGTVWLATDGGLFQIIPQGGLVRGLVRDEAGHPIVGADVLVVGTPFRTVTDANGSFVLANLPPGLQHLAVDSQRAVGGPFMLVERDVVVPLGEHTLPDPIVPPRVVGTQLLRLAGDRQTGTVGTVLAQPLLVAVVDAAGQPLSNIPVTFTVTAGNGSLTSSQAVPTDNRGQAMTLWTLGTQSGAQEVTVSTPALPDGGGATLTFTAMGLPDRSTARLIRVAGNNQSGQPGTRLPQPLVARLEDQFRNPLVGEAVTAVIRRGEAVISAMAPGAEAPGTDTQAAALTDAQGEVRFSLQVGESTQDVLVEVAALEQHVQFLTIVGAADTPGIPLDLVVVGDRVFVADSFGELQLFDVSDPTRDPSPLPAVALEGTEARVAHMDQRLYVGSNFPLRLYVLDLTQPLDAAIDALVPARVHFPAPLQRHAITGLAVQQRGQDTMAYVVTDARTGAAGTLQVVNVSNINCVRLDVAGAFTIQDGRPRGLAVTGNMAYVPAETAGLLIFDISDAAQPILVATWRDPEVASTVDTVEVLFASDITVVDTFAYLIETRRQATGSLEQHFIVLDLSIPTAPRRLGAVRLPHMATQIDMAPTIAVAGRFAYVVQFTFGLQAIDILDPAAPRLVGSVDTPSQALNVAVAGDFIYATDQIFGLQIIQGPVGTALRDTDADGIIDFFDAFPTDPTEQQDTDGDGVGDNADSDDDNDGFTDLEEIQANPPTDPQDPRSLPLTLPPVGSTTVVVDAASPFPPRERLGTAAAPYRSLTEGIRALRALRASTVPSDQPLTLDLQPGTYSPRTTQDIFPLDLSGLSHLTLQGRGGRNATVIDAGFTGDGIVLQDSTQVTLTGLTITHGGHGLLIRNASGITLGQSEIGEHIFAGTRISTDSDVESTITITESVIRQNGQEGIALFEGASATVTNNTITRNGEDGIIVAIDALAQITMNAIEANGDDGIQVGLQIGGSGSGILDTSVATIMANTIRNNGSLGNTSGGCAPGVGSGLVAAFGVMAEVSANTIEGNRLDGMVITQAATATAADNTISGHMSDGIMVEAAEATLTRNTVRDNAQDGIRVNQSTVTLTANTITGNADDGVRLAQGAMATLTDNTVSSNALVGVTLQGASTATLIGNTLDSNGSEGVFAGLGATATLIDNTVSANAGVGASFDSALAATAEANRFLNNGGNGVYVIRVTNAVLSANTVTGNGGEGGIVLEDNTSALVQGNDISGNVRNGLLIQNRSTATLTQNTVRGNGDDGIQVGGERSFLNEASSALINDTSSTDNAQHGVFLRRRSIAQFGLDGSVVTLARNGGAGLFVTNDGSQVTLASPLVLNSFDNGLEDVIILGP